MQGFFVNYECAKYETFLPTPSLHNSDMNEWILFRLAKKNHISADNKHEKIQMKGIFFLKNPNNMSMGEQQVKTEVSVQP